MSWQEPATMKKDHEAHRIEFVVCVRASAESNSLVKPILSMNLELCTLLQACI